MIRGKKRERLQYSADTPSFADRANVSHCRRALVPRQSCARGDLIQHGEVVDYNRVCVDRVKALCDCGSGCNQPRKAATGGAFQLPDRPHQWPAEALGDVILVQHVGRSILMDVIDHFFSVRRQQESQKYKFGIVEVVHIPVLPQRLSIQRPCGASHSNETSASDTDCLDLDGVHYFVRLVWSNKDHALARPCQRLALLVKYTHVERGVHRGEMDYLLLLMHVVRLQVSEIHPAKCMMASIVDSIWSSVSSGYMGRLRISSASCSATGSAPLPG